MGYIIYNDDCLNIMRNMESECIDLTVTSPPYDNLRTYNGYIKEWNFEKFKNISKELYRITKIGGVVVWIVGDATINGDETGSSFKQALYFKDIGFKLHDTMIFKKNGTGACGSNYCYWQSFEYMFVLSKGRPKTINRLRIENKGYYSGNRVRKNGEKRNDKIVKLSKMAIRQNVWEYNVGNANKDDKTGHPAVFPEQLANDHILSWSKENDTIFDPFMGSGTTGKMAVKNNRNFIGIEICEEYFEISKKRLRIASELNSQ